MKFKNLFSETCKLHFEGEEFVFNGVTEVTNKKLIEYLKTAPDFKLIEEEKSSVKTQSEEGVTNDADIFGKSEEETEGLEELKKYATELGLSFKENITKEKLEKKIDNHLNK